MGEARGSEVGQVGRAGQGEGGLGEEVTKAAAEVEMDVASEVMMRVLCAICNSCYVQTLARVMCNTELVFFVVLFFPLQLVHFSLSFFIFRIAIMNIIVSGIYLTRFDLRSLKFIKNNTFDVF